MLSRVLIKGEKFGRAAWQDQEAKLRQQMLKLFPDDSREDLLPALKDAPPVSTPQPRKDVKIVSIDLQPMAPLPGIVTLRADITHPATVPLLLQALDPDHDASNRHQQAAHPVDLVLSDGAPDVTGLHDLDIYVQSQLLFAALNLALCVLRPGGKFVAKIFRGRNVDLLYAQMSIFFERVVVAKPRSSRASSVEAFIVCIGFRPPRGFKASLEEPLGVGSRLTRLVEERERARPALAGVAMQNWEKGTWDFVPVEGVVSGSGGVEAYDGSEESRGVRWVAPFIACGDLSAFDSDASYRLPENYISLDPVQQPTAPPYKRAIELRKAGGGTSNKPAKA